MKKLIFLLCFGLTLSSCLNQGGPEKKPIDINTSELKILAIGNSFTEDGTEYLPALLEAAKCPNIIVGRAVLNGASLEDHRNNDLNSSAIYKFKVRNGKQWQTISESSTLKAAVEHTGWDIIVLQQLSDFSGMYATFQPYLNSLMSTIRGYCSNKNMVFGWQMTWAYSSNSQHPGFVNYGNNQTQMYNAIVSATAQMKAETGITLIIPSGVAIQNLRQTSLNNPPLDLTRDGSHIDFGAGRYTLACTWFQSLVSPVAHVDIIGNTHRTVSLGNVPVTGANYSICQQAAFNACRK